MPGGARPILVIEDDPTIARLLEVVLNDEGFAVLWHDRGLPALAAAARLEPQMILLDVGLPDTGGRAVLSALRANPRTAAIPVVIVSALPRDVLRHDFPDAQALVSKPFELEELLKAVAGLRAERPVE